MSEPTPSGRIVIAGGSGLIGTYLAQHLVERGYQIVVLTRGQSQQTATWRSEHWDARTVGPWIDALDGAAAIINLCGRTVDCIKTPDHRDEILRSRVEPTRAIGRAMRKVASPPPVWVQMSTAHIYGDPPELVCEEDSPFGMGLAPEVGRAWERAFEEALTPQVRPVVLRTSFVLTPKGGALARLGRIVRLGLGGPIAGGRQGISWLHIRDMNRLFERAVADDSMRGVYIATAPNPVSNRQFMRALRRSLRMPIGLPAAAWMVRLGAPLLLRTDPELALYGRYCVSRRLQEEGFEFEFPEISEALRDLLNSSGGAQSKERPPANGQA